jgi:hypothetical protein
MPQWTGGEDTESDISLSKKAQKRQSTAESPFARQTPPTELGDLA